MATTAFEELERAYDEAVGLDPASRVAYVENLRSRSGEIASRLAAMLEADTQRVDASVRDMLAEAEQRRSGDRLIGPYRVLGELGEGGFGVVYLAEQPAPIRRLVAVKLLKPGMDSKAALARFNDERQALALLDHPTIVQALDAGTSAEGWPYFVMPLVPGLAITAYCAESKATIAERVRLVIEVCRGVQHAHGRGVLHRDLKPGNVLVASEGGAARPRIIDFGLARSLTTSLTEHQTLTLAGQPLGTPEYMSPEQAAGRPVDVRSDVYALGAILYELLTGRAPVPTEALRAAGSRGIAGVVADHVVTPPSRTGNWDVRRELDWVVMRSLEKDPERRYPTADALAADLERCLDGRAVEAGPPDRVYRALSWLKHHRGLAIGAAAVLLTLIAGASVSTVMAFRERDARQSAEQVVDFLNSIFAGLDPVVAQGRDRTLLTLAIDQASASLKNTAMALEVEARLVGVLAGSYFVVGEFTKAYPFAQRSFDLTRQLYGPDDPRAIDALRMLIEAKNANVDAVSMDWLVPMTRELQDRATRMLPKGSRARLRAMAVALMGSETSRERTIAAYEALIAEAEQSLGKADRLTLMVLRRAARQRTDNAAWALSALREARRRAIEAYGPDDPETELGLATESWALASVEGTDAAIALLRDRLPHATQTLGPLAHPVFVARYNLGSMLVDKKAYAEAEPILLEVYGLVVRKHGAVSGWANWVDAALLRMYLRTGRMVEAEEVDRRTWVDRPIGPLLSTELWMELARAWVDAGRPQRAAEYLEHLRRVSPEDAAPRVEAVLQADRDAKK